MRLRLHCVVCGEERELARMALAPAGGHWCWRCQLRAQIAEHEAGAVDNRVEPALRAARGWQRPLGLSLALCAVVLVALGGARLLLTFLAALFVRC